MIFIKFLKNTKFFLASFKIYGNIVASIIVGVMRLKQYDIYLFDGVFQKGLEPLCGSE